MFLKVFRNKGAPNLHAKKSENLNGPIYLKNYGNRTLLFPLINLNLVVSINYKDNFFSNTNFFIYKT